MFTYTFTYEIMLVLRVYMYMSPLIKRLFLDLLLCIVYIDYVYVVGRSKPQLQVQVHDHVYAASGGRGPTV